MFDPGPVRLHGEARRRRARSPTCSTSTARSARRVELVAERKGVDVRDVMVVVLDRPRHEERHQGDPRRRRARAADHRRRRLAPRCSRSPTRSPVDLLWGIGGTPEGVISRRGDQVASAASSSAGCGRATTTSARPRSTPATTSSAQLTSGRPRHGRRLLLLGHRRHRRRRPAGRPLRGAAARRRPSRSSCARARAPCAASTPAHDRAKLRAITAASGTARPARAPVALARAGPARPRRSARREAPDARLGEVEAGERAQEAVGDDHVDARLRVRVDPAARAREAIAG